MRFKFSLAYSKDGQKTTFTVKEHNFRPDDITVTVDVRDVNNNTIPANDLNNELKEQQIKSYELQNELKLLSIMSNRQKRVLNEYEEKNQINEKMNYLKNEVKSFKEQIKIVDVCLQCSLYACC